ncbi:MAG: response regulator [Gammaproteobacteria bacterium]|nr:response regulator [Gammaproteobacteria bacterium]
MSQEMHINVDDINASPILIIDDEPINLAILQEILKQYPNLYCTENPEEAVALYRNQPFDLVLLDLMMPKMSGQEVLQQFALCQKKLPPPVLVLTAITDTQTHTEVLSQGASDLLTKPFNSNEVRCRIRNLLEMYHARVRLDDYYQQVEAAVTARVRQLHQNQREALKHLSHIAEYRDMNSPKHMQRVALITCALARQLAVDKQTIELLSDAATLYDIGKIGIPDYVLLKSGRYNQDDYFIKQTHCEIGSHLLESEESELMHLAALLALNHHERWDGSGYPEGLAGEAIPFLARILAVADVFDAITVNRSYRQAQSTTIATAHIKAESGRLFDPKVVAAFAAIEREILDIRQQFSDDFGDL